MLDDADRPRLHDLVLIHTRMAFDQRHTGSMQVGKPRSKAGAQLPATRCRSMIAAETRPRVESS